MLTPQQGQLPLSLDERWVARAGARAPFTLRGLRIEDPDPVSYTHLRAHET